MNSLEEYNAWRAKQGLQTIEEAPPVPEGVRNPTLKHIFDLTEECWIGLQVISSENGFKSITAFIEAIGVRKWPQ
jgi:hypothetical protein